MCLQPVMIQLGKGRRSIPERGVVKKTNFQGGGCLLKKWILNVLWVGGGFGCWLGGVGVWHGLYRWTFLVT